MSPVQDQVTGTGRDRPLFSIVVPVYNEVATVGPALDELLALELPGVAVELIVVESNSTDGSRQAVLARAHHPRMRVVLEDRPQGKGHAVRRGLAEARGDIIGIHDADLEYRTSDYPKLLAPILEGRADVVLGCRHVPGRPMRRLGSRRIQTWIVNAAHWGFTGLFDAVYGVRLRDPFTMFKIFRAECIEGLELVSDRFDFDWELLGKLIRRGYRPVEIGVDYSSRSFESGKKVRFFRDPPTWIAACLRFRIGSVPPPVPRRWWPRPTTVAGRPDPAAYRLVAFPSAGVLSPSPTLGQAGEAEGDDGGGGGGDTGSQAGGVVVEDDVVVAGGHGDGA